MRCPRCDHENPPEARFCNACGGDLATVSPSPASGAEARQLQLLQQYIPKALADRMRQLGGHLESERRHVTVVFADISGFTAMSERLDPEEVTRVMNGCFRALVEVIAKFEGTIDKFIGDEIMALFGAPIAHENDPERAIRAALEMKARLQEYNAELQVPLPKPLTMHVGINSGEVIAGNVGGDLRMDYSVLGDTVNLAARLEGVSSSGQILVSERTYALARHAFDFAKLKPFRVQGKQAKVQAYEVTGVKAAPERGRGIGSAYGRLVGRQEELGVLRRLAERVSEGQGQVVWLVGDAGIGKSRLVHELRESLPGYAQGTGASVPYGIPAPYQVFADALRTILGLASDDDDHVTRRKLEAWAAANGLPAHHLPFVGSLFGLRDEQLYALPDEARCQGVIDGVTGLLQAVGKHRPVLVVLEDLHWADDLSLRLLEAVVARARDLRVLMCCVSRPEFAPGWQNQAGCHALTVAPLPASQTKEMVESILKLEVPPELGHLLVGRTEGNPFYVEELIKALIDEGVIARTRKGYELRRDVRGIALPDTIQGVILARIDGLQAQARETVQYASVIGRRFSQALLAAVSPRANEVEQDLQQLQALDLVYQESILPDLMYIFRHFVIREVAYGNVLAERRKTIHLEVARSIERIYRDRLEEYYEALAHHFEMGEDWQKASEYYSQAGSKARELHTDQGASRFLERHDQASKRLLDQKQTRRMGPAVLLWGWNVVGSLICVAFAAHSGDAKHAVVFGLLAAYMVGAPLVLRRGQRMVLAKSIVVHTTHIHIRHYGGVIEIPYDELATVYVPADRMADHLKATRELLRSPLVIGSYSLREGFLYPDNYLIFTKRDGKRIVVRSGTIGALLRELRGIQRRKASVSQFRIETAPAPDGGRPRLQDVYEFATRKADGTPHLRVRYEQLLEEVLAGRLRQDDLVRTGTDNWVDLRAASRTDRRLRAALYPVRANLAQGLSRPKLVVITAVTTATLALLIPLRMALATAWLFPVGVALGLLLAGVLDITMRLTGWVRRVLRGLAVASFVVALVAVVAAMFLSLFLVNKRLSHSPAAGPPSTASAAPVTGIVVDGSLADWPSSAQRYPISFGLGGEPSLAQGETAQPAIGEFSVAYEEKKQLLFVAVTVNDDSLVTGGVGQNDACEILVDGSHSGRWVFPLNTLFPPLRSPARNASIVYSVIPGNGTYGSRWKGNPSMLDGDISSTETKVAFSRQGSTTTYEWAVQVFDRYPDKPSRLAPGKTIGFDVVVSNKGPGSEPSQVYAWSATPGLRSVDASTLGDLVLTGSP